jgi:hypothetical protein
MPTLFPLWRYRTTGKQCGLTATGDYQPSRSLSMADSEGRSIVDNDNSYNENITIGDDGFELHLNFSFGFAYTQQNIEKLTAEEAAEVLWKRFTLTLANVRLR